LKKVVLLPVLRRVLICTRVGVQATAQSTPAITLKRKTSMVIMGFETPFSVRELLLRSEIYSNAARTETVNNSASRRFVVKI
jgi:hypothetical protein